MPACRRNGTSRRRSDCARQVEAQLRGTSSGVFFEHMYGNEPDLWRDDLEGWERLRFIVNAFTRLRVCDATDWPHDAQIQGCHPTRYRAGAQPWFRVPWRRSRGAAIVFGHWSAQGYVDEHGVLGLDTGCVWGGKLTAQRLDPPGARPVQVPNRSGVASRSQDFERGAQPVVAKARPVGLCGTGCSVSACRRTVPRYGPPPCRCSVVPRRHAHTERLEDLRDNCCSNSQSPSASRRSRRR